MWINLGTSCWSYTSLWSVHTWNIAHQCGHLATRKTRFWLKECNSTVSQGRFRGFRSCHITKYLNFWDFGVWKKGGTEQIWVKFSKWLKDSDNRTLCNRPTTGIYVWAIFHHASHRSWIISWPNIEPNWKWDDTFSPSDLSTDGTVWISAHWMQVLWLLSRMVCSDLNNLGWVSSIEDWSEVHLMPGFHYYANAERKRTQGLAYRKYASNTQDARK